MKYGNPTTSGHLFPALCSMALCFLFLFLCPLSANGQSRSEEEARVIANDFLRKKQGKAPHLKAVSLRDVPRPVAVTQPTPSVPSSSGQGFYIFNADSNEGFVIISADSRQHTILGYSTVGTFDASAVPAGLMSLLQQYTEEYETIQRLPDNGKRLVEEQTLVVEPLIKTGWGQGRPYNGQCPINPITGDTCRAGVDAVAMAQIMNYHRFPEQGVGSHSYITDSLQIEQSMDFSACVFDWENMPMEAHRDSPDEQKNAVALLIHACGVSVDMDYAGHGSVWTKVAHAFEHYFNYSPRIKSYRRTYFTDDQWNEIILSDLKAGLPIFYRSDNGEEGDQYFGVGYVLDGCDETGSYHINWGNAGNYDGYFKLSSLSYRDRLIAERQCMVCHIIPSLQDAELTLEGDGTEASPFNAAAANAYTQRLPLDETSDEPIYIKGKVAAIQYEYNSKYGYAVFMLSDDGTLNETFEVYKAIYLDNKKYVAGPQLQIGDEVVVCGWVNNLSGSNPRTVAEQSYLVSINGKTLSDFATGDGTLDNPYNCIAAALKASELQRGETSSDAYYVKGIVSSIKEPFTAVYGNATYYISDDGTKQSQFYIYRGLSLENKKWTVFDPQIAVGDEVVVYGTMTNYNGTYEMTGNQNYIYSLNGVTTNPSDKQATGDGTVENPYNCVAALLKASELETGATSSDAYYIKGIVSAIQSPFTASYGNANYYISDDGTAKNQFYIYRGLYLENKKWTEDDPQIAVGDEVVVYGTMTNFRGTYEMTGYDNYIYSLNGALTTSVCSLLGQDPPSVSVYSPTGTRIRQPRTGVNLLQMSDGTIRKVLVK